MPSTIGNSNSSCMLGLGMTLVFTEPSCGGSLNIAPIQIISFVTLLFHAYGRYHAVNTSTALNMNVSTEHADNVAHPSRGASRFCLFLIARVKFGAGAQRASFIPIPSRPSEPSSDCRCYLKQTPGQDVISSLRIIHKHTDNAATKARTMSGLPDE